MTHLFSLPGLGNIVGDDSEAPQEAKCNLKIKMVFCVINYPWIFPWPSPSPQWSPFLQTYQCLFIALSLVLKIYLILIRLYINTEDPVILKPREELLKTETSINSDSSVVRQFYSFVGQIGDHWDSIKIVFIKLYIKWEYCCGIIS